MKFNWKIRRCVTDRGTELVGLKKIMEKFRKPGEKGDMVMHTQTGQPFGV